MSAVMAPNKRGMDDYIINSDATIEQSIAVQGDFFHVLSCPTGAVHLRFNEGKQITRYQAQGGRVYYDRVGVITDVAQTITLALGFGYATDNRATVTANITANVNPAANNRPLASVSLVAGAQGLVVAGDPNTVEMLLKNPSNSVGGVFIGDNSAGINQGYFLEPGEGMILGTKAAIYAFNPNASAVLLSLLQLRSV